MQLVFCVLYAAAAALNVYACKPPMRQTLRKVTKCLLMPLLAACYALTAGTVSPMVLGAIACGFFGDVFLIPKEKTWSFTAGLSAFAVGHVLYGAAMFLRVTSLPPAGVLVGAAFAYLLGIAGLMRALWPRLPRHLFAPCLAYMLLIAMMSMSALVFAYSRGFGRMWPLFAGSLMFILSDAVLAMATFRRRRPFQQMIIMATYIAAQTLIVFYLAFYGGV